MSRQKGSSIIAIEAKMTASVSEDDVRHLKWLKGKLGDRILDSALIYTGSVAYRRDDGIAVVPLALFGA
jgi:predicted AAA+ superfamily ATPase